MKIFNFSHLFSVFFRVLIIATIVLYFLTFILSNYSEGFLYPLIALFLPLSIFFFILNFFPVNTKKTWLALATIVSPFVLYGVFSSAVESCGFMICFSRLWVASQLSLYVYGNIAWISIVIGLMWHFVSRRKENKQRDTQEKVEKQA